MLKDLDLDVEEFETFTEFSLRELNISKSLNEELIKFKTKVESRRKDVKRFEKLLKNKKLDKQKAVKYTDFIRKVERIESKYEQERRMIIKRSIINTLENLANKLNKELLG